MIFSILILYNSFRGVLTFQICALSLMTHFLLPPPSLSSRSREEEGHLL